MATVEDLKKKSSSRAKKELEEFVERMRKERDLLNQNDKLFGGKLNYKWTRTVCQIMYNWQKDSKGIKWAAQGVLVAFSCSSTAIFETGINGVMLPFCALELALKKLGL